MCRSRNSITIIVAALLSGCGNGSGVVADVGPPSERGADLPVQDDVGPGRPDLSDDDGPISPRDIGADLEAAPLPAKCGGTAKVVLQEIATGQPDYLSLKNNGPAADLGGFSLSMMGINPVTYTFQAGTTVAASQVLYVFEYSDGQPGDVQTGDNIPFYDNLESNSVALYDTAGNLLDFVAIGKQLVAVPAGAQTTLLPWPTAYDPNKQSIQRVGDTGKCPSFNAADWAAKPITRPPTTP
jgi:hypothetical protein